MVQVNFKRGTQDAFNKISAYQDGTFYLTTDTNRLYVGRVDSEGNTIADELNKTIRQVDSFKALGTPTALNINQFYYCIQENILAYCKLDKEDNKYKWVQVNPDTNDNDTVEVSKFEAGAAESKTDSIDITLTLGQTKYTKYGAEKENSPIANKTAIVSIPKDLIKGATEVKGAEVALGASKKDNGAQITTTGTGSKAHYVDFIGSDDTNIGFTAADPNNVDSHDVITISSPVVSAAAAHSAVEASIEVKKGAESLAKLKLAPGARIHFTPDPADSPTGIKIEHETIAKATGTADSKHPTMVVSGITTDDYGHITGFNTSDLSKNKTLGKSYTLFGKNTQGEQTQTKYLGNKKLLIDLHENGSSVHTSTDATIVLDDLVTTNELNSKFTTELAKTDCMVYCGTIASVGSEEAKTATVTALPNSPKNGDTYKVSSESFSDGDKSVIAKQGDLIIAFIKDNITKWDVVPSGDEIDTTYSVKVNNKTIELLEKAGAAATPGGIGSTSFNNGAVLTATVSSTDAKNATVKYDHNTVANQSLGTVPTDTTEVNVFSDDITLVSEIKADSYGHVSKTAYKKIKLKAPDDIYVHLNSISNANKITSLMDANGQDRGTFKIDKANDSGIVVSMAGSNNNAKTKTNISYTIGFEWGEF